MTTLSTAPELSAASSTGGTFQFRFSYLRRMLLLPLLDLGTSGIFILVTHRYDVATDAAVALLLLALATLAVSVILYAPVVAFERLDAHTDASAASVRAAARIQRLPFYSAMAAFVLTVVYYFTLFALRVYTPDDANLDHVSTFEIGRGLLWYAGAFGVFYGFFIYFAVSDLMLNVRRRFRGALVFATRADGKPRSGIAKKFAAIFVVVGVMPAMLLLFDLTIFAPLRQIQGVDTERVILLDLISSFYIIGAAVLFVSRSLLAPTRELFDAQEAVKRGDFSHRAAVLTDDELGEVTARFNIMVDALREREMMESALSRYLSPSVAKALIAQGGTIESKSVDATVMFTDMEGFTALSERLGPATTVELLNAYFSKITTIITEAGGTVNNFIGDAVVAIFNVPISLDGHAKAAIEAAIEISRVMDGEPIMLSDGREFYLPTRIGINTGVVFAGVIDARQRQSYSVYGDTVNVAARIEPINKRFNTKILATKSSADAALAQGLPAATLVCLGETSVRGINAPVTVYTTGGGR